MKICFLVPSLVAGGAERVITLLANYWADKNHQVCIITLNHPKKSPFYPLSQKIELVQLNLLKDWNSIFMPLLFFQQTIAVVKAVRSKNPDSLIAFLDITIFVALLARPFIKAKVIVSERGNPYLSETNAVLKKANNFLYKYSNHIVLQTQQIARTFPAHLKKKITVISNPIIKPTQTLAAYEANNTENYLVSMGRLVKLKGYDLLIKAFASVATQNPNWTLIIIGEGEEKSQLKKLCIDYGVEEKVKFTGRLSQPAPILAQANIYVLASRYEGFPNALCEAMATGLPCIATRCQFGPEEIIEDGVNGILIEVDDEEALCKALTLLMRSPLSRKKLGEQALTITERFGLPKIAAQWEQIMERK